VRDIVQEDLRSFLRALLADSQTAIEDVLNKICGEIKAQNLHLIPVIQANSYSCVGN
jgi:hypothetical protein